MDSSRAMNVNRSSWFYRIDSFKAYYVKLIKLPLFYYLVSGQTKLLELLTFFKSFDEDDPDTWDGLEPTKTTMKELYEKFDADTMIFTAHAVGLDTDDDSFEAPSIEIFRKIKQYMAFLDQYGRSPYLYPVQGMGELLEGFMRLSTVHGYTFMLDKPFENIVYDEKGQVCGVMSGEETAKCKAVICDPTYVLDKVKKVGEVVCAYCILNHPVPNTEDSDSCKIIIPHSQVGRKSDVYIVVVSQAHQVCTKGFYLAYILTTVETFAPESELKPGLDLLGPITEKFIFIRDIYEPTDDGSKSKVSNFL
ncbi:rab GDP dissociation inhibitor alpha-like [Ptychodera flava]|uniref:rab GDP dissociation inhibitor alpha-like n=1 Tax=Ptychodera flava TaxID=63121 RepID=UPI00396A8200